MILTAICFLYSKRPPWAYSRAFSHAAREDAELSGCWSEGGTAWLHKYWPPTLGCLIMFDTKNSWLRFCEFIIFIACRIWNHSQIVCLEGIIIAGFLDQLRWQCSAKPWLTSKEDVIVAAVAWEKNMLQAAPSLCVQVEKACLWRLKSQNISAAFLDAKRGGGSGRAARRAASSKRCVLWQVAGGHTFPAGQLYKMEHQLKNCKTMLQRINVCFPLTESSSVFQRPMEAREGCLFPALSSASGRSLSRSQPSRSQPSLRHVAPREPTHFGPCSDESSHAWVPNVWPVTKPWLPGLLARRWRVWSGGIVGLYWRNIHGIVNTTVVVFASCLSPWIASGGIL